MKNDIQSSMELLAAVLTSEVGTTLDSDISNFLKKQEIDVHAELVENSASEVNLCLPYYSWIAEGNVAGIPDTDMEDASGGLFRLAPTDNHEEVRNRNFQQKMWNLQVLAHFRPDLTDHSYDGDFDAEKTNARYNSGYFDK